MFNAGVGGVSSHEDLDNIKGGTVGGHNHIANPTADSDFVVGDVATNGWVVKSLAETKALLGVAGSYQGTWE